MDTQSSNQMEKEQDSDFDFFKQYAKEEKAIAVQKNKKAKLESNIVIGLSLILLGFILLFVIREPSPTKEFSSIPLTPLPFATVTAEPSLSKEIEVAPVNPQSEQINQTIKGLQSIGEQLKETKVESDKAQAEIMKNGGVKISN